jgi:flagellar hook protein FlgE
VSNVSVGGALAGSAAAGNYTIGTQNVVGGLTGTLTAPATIAGLGGIAGTYTVNLVSQSGSGTGGVATISYGGNGTINSIQLSGGTGYTNDTLTIPAGSLGAGSAAVTLGSVAASNLVNGTQLTLSNGVGTPIPSAQTVIAGSAGGVQTFTFTNGLTFTLNTPAGDTAAGIAAGMNGKVITVGNNPVGTMAFVAGKNIDGLQRDQFGVPAYTTKTSLSTTVGSATRVNQLAITIDSTDMTAYSAAQSSYKNTQDGNSLSQLTAYNIDNSGILQATYDNGQTLMKGQLAIANFNNTAGLIPVGNNSFEMSGITGLQSGAAIFGTANSGNLGSIRSKAVESSNVDLTSELVKLMTLQRQYTANSQAVKVEAATIVDDAIRIGQ